MDADGLYVFCVQKTCSQRCNSAHTINLTRVDRPYTQCWSRFVFPNGFVYCCLQRDVFNQLLIHAALKSENKHHQKLAR